MPSLFQFAKELLMRGFLYTTVYENIWLTALGSHSFSFFWRGGGVFGCGLLLKEPSDKPGTLNLEESASH